ncbi:MAG TPA: hypothetical protein VIV12_14795 [Streptosporangiaceae bacterium]
MAALLQAHGPDFDRITTLAAGYHLSFNLYWVEELAAHGVSVLGQ